MKKKKKHQKNIQFVRYFRSKITFLSFLFTEYLFMCRVSESRAYEIEWKKLLLSFELLLEKYFL